MPNPTPYPDASEALAALQARFERSGALHEGVSSAALLDRLMARPEALRSLAAMEASGGEPNAVLLAGELCLVDTAKQSPKGRRSLCFDREAREARVKFPPLSSALEEAQAMGVELLDEARYGALQQLLEFDTTTSSWLATPARVRELGGALFAERRYERVFVFANGADAYFSSRGWRGLLSLGAASAFAG